MCYTPLINEVAIALMYLLGEADPIEWTAHLLKGYHAQLPLLAEEIDVLYYLVAGRLCASVVNSAHTTKLKPDSTYITVSEQQAWTLLRKWISVNPIAYANGLKKALGLRETLTLESASILNARHRYIPGSFSVSYSKPIHMIGAAFQYMYAADGTAYLDAYNNIPHVGHTHPKVVEAGQKAMAKLNTNTRYLFTDLHEYAEQLTAKLPAGLDKVFFVNSGSAASDLAIRIARTVTQRTKIACMEHGYHGNTSTGIDISHYKFNGKGGQGQGAEIIRLDIPDTYQGPHTDNDGTAGKAYFKEAEHLLAAAEGEIAAFITEPIVGCGGQVPLAEGYLPLIYEAIRNQGGLCISDEVQTGFGRMGSHFWGFELYDVVPDMVILGKPMGNGHPLAAVVTTAEIAVAFNNGMEFFSSFGGNPVSCAIGKAVLEVLEAEGLQANALEVGTHYMAGLRKLGESYPWIGDVRGSGLFIGMELVKDRESKTPYPKLAAWLKNGMRDRGILLSTDGPFDSVIKSKPPMCFSKSDSNLVISELDTLLKGFNPG